MVNPIVYEYELCFKCHSSYTTLPSGAEDKGAKFNTNNPSYHPVEGTGKNLGIRDESFTLGTPWNPTSGDDANYSASSGKVTCSDCHGSNVSTEPVGPHGSSIQYILKKAFKKAAYWSTSASSELALCFNCHAYGVYYSGNTGSRFRKHDRHVQDEKVSCYACHTVHGSTGYIHLIRIKGASESVGIVTYTHSSDKICDPTCHGDKNYSHEY